MWAIYCSLLHFLAQKSYFLIHTFKEHRNQKNARYQTTSPNWHHQWREGKRIKGCLAAQQSNSGFNETVTWKIICTHYRYCSEAAHTPQAAQSITKPKRLCLAPVSSCRSSCGTTLGCKARTITRLINTNMQNSPREEIQRKKWDPIVEQRLIFWHQRV